MQVFSRGERIPQSGVGRGLRLRVIRKGLATASATLRDGRRQIMCILVPGDIICPFDIGAGECWAESLTDTETVEIELPAAGQGIGDCPEFARLLFDLSHRLLGRALAHVVELGRFDGTERVCAFLLDMIRRVGRPCGAGWSVSLPMSREDIADYLGLNAETVSRICTRIKKEGIAKFHSPTECEVPDLARLEARVPIRGIGRSACPAGMQQGAHS